MDPFKFGDISIRKAPGISNEELSSVLSPLQVTLLPEYEDLDFNLIPAKYPKSIHPLEMAQQLRNVKELELLSFSSHCNLGFSNLLAVKLNPGVTLEKATLIVQSIGLETTSSSTYSGVALSTRGPRIRDSIETIMLAAYLQKTGLVSFAGPNYFIKVNRRD